jgi:hypothetical protein
MPQFVAQGEVLAAAVGSGGVEDHPVAEERDAVACPTITAQVGEVVGSLDPQADLVAEHRDRIGGEAGAQRRGVSAARAASTQSSSVFIGPRPPPGR